MRLKLFVSPHTTGRARVCTYSTALKLTAYSICTLSREQLDREHILEFCKRMVAKGPDGCAVSDDEEGEV